MTDEAYALASSPRARAWPGRRIVWLQVFLQLYWVAGAADGALAGTVVPARLQGLDFALTALFAVLTVDAVRARRDLPLPALALGCARRPVPVPGRDAAGGLRDVHRRAGGPACDSQEARACLT